MSEHQANAIKYICVALIFITLFLSLSYSEVERGNNCHCDQMAIKK